MQPGEGERLHAERRKRYWRIIALLAGVGLVGGFFSGFAMGYDEGSGGQRGDLIRSICAVGVVLFGVLTAYGSWRFFVQADEVEVADNLWGSLIGFYAYAILFPSWWLLHRLERAPELDHWVIYAVAMITALAAYGYRKWRIS